MAKNEDILKLRNSSVEEVKSKIIDLRKSLMGLKFELSTGQIKDLSTVRKTKKDIARLKTFITELETKNKKG